MLLVISWENIADIYIYLFHLSQDLMIALIYFGVKLPAKSLRDDKNLGAHIRRTSLSVNKTKRKMEA